MILKDPQEAPQLIPEKSQKALELLKNQFAEACLVLSLISWLLQYAVVRGKV